jgi:hypothetical protein
LKRGNESRKPNGSVSMKTICEGIEFRSRTEAAWFLVFKRYGLNPVYGPETFTIEIGDGKTIWYMPDFKIDLFGSTTMVEIKAGLDGEIQDIAKACILGYQVPTLIVVGWPLKYQAVLIEERNSGNPSGSVVHFWDKAYRGDDVTLACSYPDETGLEMDPSDMREFSPNQEMRIGTLGYRIASESWNATKWKR